MKNVIKLVGEDLLNRMFGLIGECSNAGAVSPVQEELYFELQQGFETLCGTDVKGVLKEPLGSIVLKDDSELLHGAVAATRAALEAANAAPMVLLNLKPGRGLMYYDDDRDIDFWSVKEVRPGVTNIAQLKGWDFPYALDDAVFGVLDVASEFFTYWAEMPTNDLELLLSDEEGEDDE